MTIQTDPIDYCFVDENESNQAALPLAEASNGFVDEQELPADKFNTIARSAAAWSRYHDQGKLPVEQAVGTTSCRLSDELFEYTSVPGLTQSLVDDSYYLINGRFVPLTADRITGAGIANILTRTFAASKDTHFYLRADGDIQVSEVAVATPPSAPAGYVWLRTVTTNGTDVLSQTTGTSFVTAQVRATRPWVHEGLAIDKEDTAIGSLDFWNDGDPDAGWRVDLDADERLAFYEKNGLNATVMHLGDVSNPIAVNRQIQVNDDLIIPGGASGGRVYSSGSFLKRRTHTPTGAVASAFGIWEQTIDKLAAAENTAHTLDTGTLADGVYSGQVRVQVIQVGSNAVHAFLVRTISVYVISGVAVVAYNSGDHSHDAIGLTSIAVSASGGSIRVLVTIPNLGGTPTFNIHVVHNYAYANNG